MLVVFIEWLLCCIMEAVTEYDAFYCEYQSQNNDVFEFC